MASTFANRDTCWYIRAGGNELNGGGFDPYVAGAGTNYCDQDSPQLSSTTGTCTVGSTTWTDTGVTFTAAMVGNVIRISAVTGGSTIALDYFVVTAFIDANNVTLDRSPCATANITAATWRLGGAHAHIYQYASTAHAGTAPALATPLVGGNTIYVRGTGGLDPTVVEYDWSGGYWSLPNGGNDSGGNCRMIGYPSGNRPLIGHRGIMVYDWKWSAVEHIKFKQTNGTFTGQNIAPIGWNTSSTSFYDCIFDANGMDSCQMRCGNNSDGSGSTIGCEMRNTAGGAAGTVGVIAMVHCGGFHYGNWIHGMRGSAFTCDGIGGTVFGNVVNGNGSNGYTSTGAGTADIGPVLIANNTFDANGGHGITLPTGEIEVHAIFNNLITNHVGASKYGINFTEARSLNVEKYKELIGFNDYYGNTTNFPTVSGSVSWGLPAAADASFNGDLTLDPGYANAGSNDFTPGANVAQMGAAKPASMTTTDYKINMGAVFK